MNIVWLLYWVGVLVAVGLSFQAIKQKSFVTGLVQLVLSIVVPLGQLLFSIVNGQSGTGKNEFCFLMDYVVKFDFFAILIFIGYIAIIVLTFYHLFNFCGKNKNSEKTNEKQEKKSDEKQNKKSNEKQNKKTKKAKSSNKTVKTNKSRKSKKK